MGKINDLKNQALATLRGKWGSFVGITLIYCVLTGIASGLSSYGNILQTTNFSTLSIVCICSGVLLTLLMLPIGMGYSVALLHASRQDLPADPSDLFYGYKNFWHVLGTYILLCLAVFAGIILFVIPGIILALAYAMVPYILRDHPELSVTETLWTSRMMMKGHKWELFVLELSFIGWALLCVLTLFIGYLWLMPYMQMTIAKFYEKIRVEYEGAGTENTAVGNAEMA